MAAPAVAGELSPPVSGDHPALVAGTDRVQVNVQSKAARVEIFFDQVRFESPLVEVP